MTEQELAEACARQMWDRDAASQGLGMRLGPVAPGQAQLTMDVTPEMVNGHGICHGGLIFSLADSAFAFACNSRNQVQVALSCSIDYLAPGFAGDCLTATARERRRSRRTGLFEVSVTNQAGEELAHFRGRSFALDQTVLRDGSPDDEEPADD